MSWKRRFEDPVELPNGKIALTLKDAGDYITKLHADESNHPKWQTAMHVLIEAAEGRGPMSFARLNQDAGYQQRRGATLGARQAVTPATKWGWRKLARDL